MTSDCHYRHDARSNGSKKSSVSLKAVTLTLAQAPSEKGSVTLLRDFHTEQKDLLLDRHHKAKQENNFRRKQPNTNQSEGKEEELLLKQFQAKTSKTCSTDENLRFRQRGILKRRSFCGERN